MSDHEVGAVALGDVEHLRAELDPRWRYGKAAKFEFLEVLQVFEDRDWLATRWVVVKDVGDFLALELAAQFVLDEMDRSGGLRPIGRRDRKQIGKAFAVCRGRNAKSRRGAGDLVFDQLLVQRLRLRRAIDQHGDSAH